MRLNANDEFHFDPVVEHSWSEPAIVSQGRSADGDNVWHVCRREDHYGRLGGTEITSQESRTWRSGKE